MKATAIDLDTHLEMEYCASSSLSSQLGGAWSPRISKPSSRDLGSRDSNFSPSSESWSYWKKDERGVKWGG